jgi:hypothetical protein
MPHYLCQVIFEHDSALPEDRMINTFSFFAANERDDAIAALITTALANFYAEIDQRFSTAISNVVTTKFYDRGDPTPRQPFFTDTFVINQTAGASLPEEVALCLSFKAAAVSGVGAGQTRGRVFLGPLNTGCLGIGEASNGSRPHTDVMTDVVQAGISLLTASQAANNWSWEVWTSVGGVGREVVAGWVDNAFDTQRRRGLDATSRDTFP